MPPKKGLSKDDKMKAMLDLMMESNDIWTLKDLEKDCPKKKGIPAMKVKEILQELCDNDEVMSDKIGNGNFFWCFPSEAYNRRKVQENNIMAEIQNYNREIAQLEAEIAQLTPGREESPERSQLDQEISEFQSQINNVKSEASKYEKMNPEAIKKAQRQAAIAFDAANRWTDNIFTIKSWTAKKFGILEKDFNKNFELGENFDYFE
ncbi:Mnd1 family protein [Tritrichomonas foetus]|uniref:Mnd1 family protein n=1 Tax=Tritrichomonas foetus TaxID=1144522 RepID=A0A1J4J6I7_9EUKA|nr:Mnd1 family protein [Tritrichomonas foetus]|eukprot:OHS92788.1 Mnd1 family protein [Tritrichomonas foetus]